MLLSGAVFCAIMLAIDLIAEKVKKNSEEKSEDSKDWLSWATILLPNIFDYFKKTSYNY